MAEWRYIATRLGGNGTEVIIDPDLPLLGPQVTKVLSGPNGLSGKISPALARLIGDDGLPLITPWSTCIYALEDEAVQCAGIVTNTTKSGPDLSITGVGFTGAIKGQPYSGSTFFVEKDPLDIVRHIWAHWQSLQGGNLGLVVDPTTKAGVKIGTTLTQVQFDTQAGPVSFEAGPVKLNEWTTHDLGGLIDQFASDYHFDYAERHAWNADRTGFTHNLDFGAPRIGVRRDDLRFVVGENVVVPPDEDDASEAYASGVLVLGAGEGASMKRSFVPRAGESRLRRVYVQSDTTLKSTTATTARGQQLLPLLTGEVDITELVIRDHHHAPVGAWREGDEILVQTDSPWGDTQMWVRILSTTFSPEVLGVARVSVVRADKIPS